MGKCTFAAFFRATPFRIVNASQKDTFQIYIYISTIFFYSCSNVRDTRGKLFLQIEIETNDFALCYTVNLSRTHNQRNFTPTDVIMCLDNLYKKSLRKEPRKMCCYKILSEIVGDKNYTFPLHAKIRTLIFSLFSKFRTKFLHYSVFDFDALKPAKRIFVTQCFF